MCVFFLANINYEFWEWMQADNKRQWGDGWRKLYNIFLHYEYEMCHQLLGGAKPI